MRRVMLALTALALALAGILHASGFWQDTFIHGWQPGWVFFGVMALGLAALYYACRRGWWQAWRFTLLGTIAGSVAALPFAVGPRFFTLALFLCASAGALVGWLFWLAAVWRNRELIEAKILCLPDGTKYPVARGVLKFSPDQSK